MLRVVEEIKPTWVVGENVAGIITMVQPGEITKVEGQASLFEEDYSMLEYEQDFVIETICGDLERIGYQVQPIVIPACGVGAPHRRDRVWFIAHTTNSGIKEMRERIIIPDEFRSFTNPKSEQGEWVQPKQRKTSKSEQGESRGGFSKDGCEWNDSHSSSERCNNRGNHRQERHFQDNLNRYAPKDKSEWDRWKCGISKVDKTVKVTSDTECIRQQGQGRTEKSMYSEKDGEWKASWTYDDGRWPTEPPICNGNDGIQIRLDGITFSKWRDESIKGGGNAIVPQVAFEIFKFINEIEND